MTASRETGFELFGVVHLVRPVGVEVRDLEELKAAVERIPERSLFHHAAGRLLRHPSSDELPPDDLSGWVAGVVQDRQTAERMSFAVESARNSGELRDTLVAVLASVPEKDRIAHDAPPAGELVLLMAESVPIPTGDVARTPRELIDLLTDADSSVWFYHLVEEPWMLGETTPLAAWLERQGAGWLAELFFDAAHAGQTLDGIRRRVLRRWRFNRLGQRVAAASHSTEKERLDAGREVVARLVRRINRPGDDA